ncbi:MAG: hypothetical protein ACE5F8_07280 [Woeseiaceae bacterium]
MSQEQHSHSGRKSVLLVHGRDFKPDNEALFDISVDAMRYGIQRDYPDCLAAFDAIEMGMSYYGDLTNALLTAQGKKYDENLDIGDRRNALRTLKEIPARKRFGIRQYDQLPGKSAIPEAIADTVYPVLGLCGLSMPIIGRLSRDFGEYLRGTSSYADDVRARLRDRLSELFDRGDHVMLISHGTGSAVAWDVLWQLSHDAQLRERHCEHKLDAWVSMGAPLGDRHVRNRLAGAREKSAARFPTNVIAWYNIAAEDDYTCHDKTLADDFKKMMKERVVSAVQDYRVFNHAVRYGRSNPHSSIGYYIHPRLAKIIADWIGPPPTPAIKAEQSISDTS